MRVGDLGASDCRIGIQGDDLKQPRHEVVATKDDTKAAQFDFFQRDRRGDDTDRFFAKVESNILEFVGERLQFIVEQALRR
jgi:hypothetical protein